MVFRGSRRPSAQKLEQQARISFEPVGAVGDSNNVVDGGSVVGKNTISVTSSFKPVMVAKETNRIMKRIQSSFFERNHRSTETKFIRAKVSVILNQFIVHCKSQKIYLICYYS